MKHLPLYPQLPTANTATGVQPLPHNKSCTNCPLCAHTPAGQRCLPPRGETGDILVVLESPEESERRSGEAGTGGNAQTILRVLEKLAPGRKVAVTYAIGCSIPRDREEYDVYAAGCRPYLAAAIQAVQPKIVLLFGSLAGLGVLGRTFQPMSVRSGYGWLLEENKNPIPCFFFPSVSEVRNNDLLQRAVDEDIKAVCIRSVVHPSGGDRKAGAALETTDHPGVQPLPLQEQYSCIEDGADAELAWELLSISETLIATDTETSGVMHEDEFYVACIAVSDGTNHFLFPRHTWTTDETAREYLGCILELLQHTSWNGQYDYCAIKCDKTLGFELNLVSDARLKRKLYEADARGSLEVAAELVGMGGHKEEMQGQVAEICDDLRKYALSFQKTPTGKTRTWKGSKHFQPTDIPQLWLEQLTDGMPPERFAYGFVRADVLHRYCVLDALATARLEQKYHSLLSQFQDDGLLRIWNEVTYPAMKAYCRMRMNGLPVSKPGVESFKLWLEAEMATTLGQIHGTAPGLNPTSNPQVVELLEKLGIRSKRKTGSGKPSASKEVLEDLEDKHPVIGKILRYRMLQKIHGTYAVGMLPYIRSTGCVHSSFLQDGTETGRPSAAEPNTLNLVKGRDEETRTVADLFRSCFAAPPGWTLVEADEKQIEIRLAADLSADPEMCSVISSGLDFHKASAEKFAIAQGRDPATVTDLDREQAKTSNFAAVYEIPAELGFMLSMRLKIPRDEADKLGKALFASFTRLRAWMEEEYAAARKVGYARTYWMGSRARRRPLWGLGHNPRTLALLEDALSAEKLAGRRGYYDKNAARSTYNTPVQGSAVDIVASMLWPVQQWLDANTDGGKLILHVYDSIMVLVRDKDVPATVAMLRRLMTAPGYTKHVPLDVDIKTGKYWNALVKFKPC